MSVVTVGLKLANSLVISITDDNGKEHTQLLNGHNKGIILTSDMHGITSDVSEEFWNKWVQQNKNSDLYKGGFIFAHASEKNVKAEAKEKKANKSKTEAINPDDLPKNLEEVK